MTLTLSARSAGDGRPPLSRALEADWRAANVMAATPRGMARARSETPSPKKRTAAVNRTQSVDPRRSCFSVFPFGAPAGERHIDHPSSGWAAVEAAAAAAAAGEAAAAAEEEE